MADAAAQERPAAGGGGGGSGGGGRTASSESGYPSSVGGSGSFATALARHLRWQRALLRSLTAESTGDAPPVAPASAKPVRFLVLRPGDKLTVCSASGMSDVRAACHRTGAPKSPRPPATHWDTHVIQGKPRLSRPIPGLGNVALSVVAAAATAIVSQRVLLLENLTAPAASFGGPMREMLLDASSGWLPHLAAAQQSVGSVDGFAAHDDYSAFSILCGSDLRRQPAARVWRIFSNQYFLPLLLLNPHHAPTLEALAQPLIPRTARSSSRSSASSSSWWPLRLPSPQPSTSPVLPGVQQSGAQPAVGVWSSALRAVWRPSPRLKARLAAFRAVTRLEHASYVGMHIRVNLAEQPPPRLAAAAACAAARLAAANASTLFVATMFASNRRLLASRLRPMGVRVVSYGKAVEAQGESEATSDSAMADMLLMGGATEVLISPGSTFGYVAHGLSGGRATLYGGTHTSRDLVSRVAGDCLEVPTSEPNFHFLKHALRSYATCRAGAQAARRRGSSLYERSALHGH